jgi:3-phenylpropionate/cinnamic acid dioxygenase small subunit
MSSNGEPAGEPGQDPALWYALYSLTTRYWRDVDFNAGRKAHEFYQAHGVFIAGNNRFDGRDSIRAFYAWRERHGQTTTRHLISNQRVSGSDTTNSSRILRDNWRGVVDCRFLCRHGVGKGLPAA